MMRKAFVYYDFLVRVSCVVCANVLSISLPSENKKVFFNTPFISKLTELFTCWHICIVPVWDVVSNCPFLSFLR